MKLEWKFRNLFFYSADSYGESDSFNNQLAKAVREGQAEGYEYHDVKFAQSSASGTGMSALLVLCRRIDK